MKERVLPILACLLLLVGIAIALQWWPPRPQAQWNATPDTLVLEVASHPFEGGTYQPGVQLWGDGRIIWYTKDAGENWHYVEGHLSSEAMRDILERVIDAGAFDPMLDLGGGVVFQYLYVNLLDQQVCMHNSDDRMEHMIEADENLLRFLHTGAGAQARTPIPMIAPTKDCR